VEQLTASVWIPGWTEVWQNCEIAVYNGDMVKIPTEPIGPKILGCKFPATPGLYKIMYRPNDCKESSPAYFKIIGIPVGRFRPRTRYTYNVEIK
jgi:hypothetical protein